LNAFKKSTNYITIVSVQSGLTCGLIPKADIHIE